MCATCHPPTPLYHNGCVSNSVFWYDHTVTVSLPLRRLVLHIGDGDGQLHWAAPVPSVCSHNFPGDVGPLYGTENIISLSYSYVANKQGVIILASWKNDKQCESRSQISASDPITKLLCRKRLSIGYIRVNTNILKDNCIDWVEFCNPFTRAFSFSYSNQGKLSILVSKGKKNTKKTKSLYSRSVSWHTLENLNCDDTSSLSSALCIMWWKLFTYSAFYRHFKFTNASIAFHRASFCMTGSINNIVKILFAVMQS